jgi:hypothetical protein
MREWLGHGRWKQKNACGMSGNAPAIEIKEVVKRR